MTIDITVWVQFHSSFGTVWYHPGGSVQVGMNALRRAPDAKCNSKKCQRCSPNPENSCAVLEIVYFFDKLLNR